MEFLGADPRTQAGGSGSFMTKSDFIWCDFDDPDSITRDCVEVYLNGNGVLGVKAANARDGWVEVWDPAQGTTVSHGIVHIMLAGPQKKKEFFAYYDERRGSHLYDGARPEKYILLVYDEFYKNPEVIPVLSSHTPETLKEIYQKKFPDRPIQVLFVSDWYAREARVCE